MTRRRRSLLILTGLLLLVAVEAGAGLARPEVAPLWSPADALGALALLSPLALLGGLHRLGPAALGALGVTALGPHAGRLAGWPVPDAAFMALGLALFAVAWRSPRLGLLAPLAALALAPLPTWLRPGPLASAAESGGAREDLLLITVDTLRADAALPLPGEGWLVVEQAVSAAPWTLPAMDSLMTGAAVRRHRGGLPVDGGYTRPGPEWRPLAERLAEAGYATAAFVSNPHLRAALGFDRGFQRFVHADLWGEPHYALHALFAWRQRWTGRVERLRSHRDGLLVDAALRWWAEAEGPRFAWVHLLLPHEYARDPQPRPTDFDPKDPEQLRAAYAGNVAATAAPLRRLVEGVGPEARVALTSDHGESLGEDGRWGHGSALVDPQLRVPLALRGFGASGRHAGRPVALTDLADALVEGDLAPMLRGRAVVEVGGLRRDAGAFALRVGPADYTSRPPPQGPAPAALRLEPELQRALEALGYLDR